MALALPISALVFSDAALCCKLATGFNYSSTDHTLPTQRDVYGRHLLSDTIAASGLNLSNADHARSPTQRNVRGLAQPSSVLLITVYKTSLIST
ncbi:unnamed protein product [Camellia sinensis]